MHFATRIMTNTADLKRCPEQAHGRPLHNDAWGEEPKSGTMKKPRTLTDEILLELRRLRLDMTGEAIQHQLTMAEAEGMSDQDTIVRFVVSAAQRAQELQKAQRTLQT